MMRRRILIGCGALVLSGCGTYRITTNEVKANATAFATEKELLAVLGMFDERIKSGLPPTVHEAFVALRVNTKDVNIEVLRKDTILNLIYGSGFRSNDRAMLREEVLRYSGVQIPFVNRREQGVLSAPFHIQYFENGYDLGVVLIFDRGQLMSADHFGVAVIDRTRRTLLWNPFSSIGQSLTNRTTIPGR